MRVLRSIALLLLLGPGWVFAGEPEVPNGDSSTPELKGLFLGMSEVELLARMPEFECHPPQSWSGYLKLVDRVCDAKQTSIAGQPARAIALFLEDRMEAVTFHPVSAASFPIIADALLEKYGPADDDVTELFVSRGGDSAENRWLHWKLKSGHRLVAREHFTFLGSPGVRLLTPWAATSIKGYFLAPPKNSSPTLDL